MNDQENQTPLTPSEMRQYIKSLEAKLAEYEQSEHRYTEADLQAAEQRGVEKEKEAALLYHMNIRLPHYSFLIEHEKDVAVVTKLTILSKLAHTRGAARMGLAKMASKLKRTHLRLINHSKDRDILMFDPYTTSISEVAEGIRIFVEGTDDGEQLRKAVNKIANKSNRNALRKLAPGNAGGRPSKLAMYAMDLREPWNAIVKDHPEFVAVEIVSHLLKEYRTKLAKETIDRLEKANTTSKASDFAYQMKKKWQFS